MSDGWGTLSFLEGIRLVLAAAGVAASIWAVVHARDGSMAFARPIRERMIQRRRVQMAGNLAICVILGAQTTSAAQVPDPAVITSAGTAVSYAVIAVLGIILVMTLMFSIGWAGVQEIVANTPLQPDDRERLEEATDAGRSLGHLITNGLQHPVGVLSLLESDPQLTARQREDVRGALAALEVIGKQAQGLHATIKAAAG